MTTYTTLNKIRAHSPCANGWETLIKHLGKTQADDEPLALTTILDSNGLYDALWCLRACEGIDREARLYAVWCARQVQHLLKDQRSLAALDVAERYANGEATPEELDVARHAAWDAAWDEARDAARAALRGTASSAASSAAEAARAAAWDEAEAALRGTAGGTASSAAAAASDAAREAQTAEFRRVFG